MILNNDGACVVLPAIFNIVFDLSQRRALSEMTPGEVTFFPAGTSNFNHWREIVVEVLLKKVTIFDDLWRQRGAYGTNERQLLLCRLFK